LGALPRIHDLLLDLLLVSDEYTMNFSPREHPLFIGTCRDLKQKTREKVRIRFSSMDHFWVVREVNDYVLSHQENTLAHSFFKQGKKELSTEYHSSIAAAIPPCL
jgi:hypothetical protein